MPTSHPTPFLRYALVGDAAASGATGLLMAAGASGLAGLLGLPEGLLRYAGLFLVAYAVAVAVAGTRVMVSRRAVWAVIALNGAWVIESIVLLMGPWVSPTALGTAFVLIQAAVVLGFAEAQYIGLRRTRTSAVMA